MRKWAVALAALWMVMGSPPVSLGAEGVTLPKDLPLPTDASVAIYLPKHIREFRNPFRSGGGFQTTNALQLGASFEELTLGAAQHFFKTSFMYEPTGTPAFGLLVAIRPSLKREDQQVIATAHYQVYDGGGASLMQGDTLIRWAPGSPARGPDYVGNLSEQAITRALTEIVAQLRPTASKYPSQGEAAVKIEKLIDREHPAVSGTGRDRSAGPVRTSTSVPLVLVSVTARVQPCSSRRRWLSEIFKKANPSVVVVLTREKEIGPAGDAQPVSVAGVGSGVLVSNDGKVLTAAHVVHDCASVDVHYGKDSVAVTTTANSALLDLAVLETHANSEHFLSLRDHAELGESVINVGFPLQTLMTDAPTVTRGTLSSRAGLSGSVGQFQFSAPIQPGASGGPVVDVRGNVLGVAVGTLNASELLKSGVLPQNVNFALESRYVEKFLQQHSVLFTEGSADAHAPGEVSIDEVLPAVVSIKCYQ